MLVLTDVFFSRVRLQTGLFTFCLLLTSKQDVMTSFSHAYVRSYLEFIPPDNGHIGSLKCWKEIRIMKVK